MTDATPLTDADLDAIRERLGPVTPGAWDAEGATREDLIGVEQLTTARIQRCAPTDVARLLAEVERLRNAPTIEGTWARIIARAEAAEAEVERLRAENERINSWLFDSGSKYSELWIRAEKAEAANAALRSRIEAVRALHFEGILDDGEHVCADACLDPWPCPTIAALSAQIGE